MRSGGSAGWAVAVAAHSDAAAARFAAAARRSVIVVKAFGRLVAAAPLGSVEVSTTRIWKEAREALYQVPQPYERDGHL
jgi:hypothetical protein